LRRLSADGVTNRVEYIDEVAGGVITVYHPNRVRRRTQSPCALDSIPSIVIGILLAGLTLSVTSCTQIQFINSKDALPTMCTAYYPPSIGNDLVVGESSDELLRKVGKPNVALSENGYIYYSYFVQPYLLSGFSSKYVERCDAQPIEDSSTYFVTLDADRRIESVVFWIEKGAASQEVKVPGADGLPLPATLYSPRGCSTERKPGLVLLHGWLPEGTTNAGLGWIPDAFAQQGYVVLVPLMRGWGGGQNDCGLSQPADVARAIEWLASQPDVDPDRIGVVGFSLGGQVALLTGALNHRVKAIVSYYGPTDLTALNAHYLYQWHQGLEKECRSDLKSRSPVTVASQIRAPVLLIQGDADTTVPPEQAQEMEQAIWKSDGSVQLNLVSGAGHELNRVVIPAWPATQRFLDAALGKPSCVQTLHATSASAQPTPRALQAQ
jgi:dienelactone hydrolase